MIGGYGSNYTPGGGPAFSEVPFAAGTLVGQRAFFVYRGRGAGPELQGVTCRTVFQPGINLAACLSNGGTGRAAYLEPKDPPKHDARLIPTDCQCGYYAYFSGANVYHSEFCVEAIVEGFGRCVYGSLGFRAQKLRLLALTRRVGGKLHPTHAEGPCEDCAHIEATYNRCVAPHIDAIAERFGVPVYDTTGEALAAHPLTRMEVEK